MKTEIDRNSLKVIFTKQLLTKATIFRCFDVFSVFSKMKEIFKKKNQITACHNLKEIARKIAVSVCWLQR